MRLLINLLVFLVAERSAKVHLKIFTMSRVSIQDQILQDQFGLRVALRLSGGVDELPWDTIAHLLAARVKAISVCKLAQTKIAYAADFKLASLTNVDRIRREKWH